MGLLKKAKNEQCFLKAGLFGDTGSGKTTTGGLLALGISKTFCNGAPVAMMDTERASDFLLGIFEAEGVELLVHKSRSFADMMTVLGEAQKAGCCAFIVDSVTHTWGELQDAYRKKLSVKKLEFQHWAIIKGVWQEWTDAFLTTPIHTIVNGRAGYEYEYQTNEQGKKELIKGDTKMRTEGQFGYEPNLLVEMEKVRIETTKAKRGGSFEHHAHVLKDRSWALNGKTLKFHGADRYRKGGFAEVMKAFGAHVAALNLGGKHQQLDSGSSEGMFDSDGSSEWPRMMRERTIALEEIQSTITLIWPGQDAATKRIKTRLVEAIFGTRSWTAVESQHPREVAKGLKLLKAVEAEYAPATHADDSAVVALVEMIRERLANSNGGPEGYTAPPTDADELGGEQQGGLSRDDAN